MAGASNTDRPTGVGAALARARRPDSKQMEALKGRTPLWFLFLFLFGLATYQIMMNPFGFSDLTQRYTQDISDLLITGPYFYGRDGHEKISVAIVDDAALENLQMPWPWTYGMQARALDSILANNPRAVIVDLVFVDPRKDATLGELIEEIHRYKQAGVPLYLVGASEVAEGEPGVRKEIAATGVKILDPSILLNQGIARQYPIEGRCFGADASKSGCYSLALSVYRDLYPGKVRSDLNGLMEIVWGTRTDPFNKKWQRVHDEDGNTFSCQSDMSFIRRIWLAFLDPEEVRSRCTYHAAVPVQALMQGSDDPDFENAIKNKIVFYGAQLEGVQDKAFTPVNGMIAAVFVHAMALDNLITMHGRPEQNVVTIGDVVLDSNPVQVIAIMPVLLILSWTHRRRLRRRALPEDRSAAVEYIVEKLTEWFWHGFAYLLALGMGLLLAVAVGLSVANWVEVVFVSVELAALLLLGVPDTIWGYINHVIGVIAELDDEPEEKTT
ncbi:MAG: CHASE2 domain-containing protein [Alphaproteobacteria bacterium]|nr:CHASE2 domain-containing protein [Alphaproteobacteria bacterium]